MTDITTTSIAHIIYELKKSLQETFGNRLENVLLFGSHARGEADTESDIDILVILSSTRDFKNDESRCLSISQRLSLNYDVVISCIVVLADDLHIKRPLFLNIQREGVAIL